MSRAHGFLWAVLCVSAAAAAGCNPAGKLDQRITRLPGEVYPVVRDAVWAHGNPYTWTEQRNVVIEANWSDYRHGFKPMVNHKIYTIDLTTRRMRIDDLTIDGVSLYNGARWRVLVKGHEIRKPDVFNEETAPYLALLEYAASEMRIIRLLFALPFNLVDDGVHLKSLGQVQTSAGGNVWNVLRTTFDTNTTGFLKTDRALVYFDPRSHMVDRVFVRLSGEPFYSMPFWGEWADYRRLDNGLLVPHRWEFRRTDAQGAADQGRRLSIVLSKVAFNVDLPWDVFGDPAVKPPPIPDEQALRRVKTIGEDDIDTDD